MGRSMAWRAGALLPLCLTGVLAQSGAPAAKPASCPPDGHTVASLRTLQSGGFEVPLDADRERLARSLVACLSSPDPALRDELAFSAYTAWMRGKRLPVPVLRDLREVLYVALEAPDPQGFRAPFAALTLAEVARTDRIDPWMTEPERAAMVTRAVTFVSGVRDYRGFDAQQGWRHGVAHGADWLLQLALNPALTRPQRDLLLSAVAVQVMPAAGHAYVFDEPARLARPVLAIARLGEHGEPEWTAWLGELVRVLHATPEGWKDPAWLARRHDLKAFLNELYVNAALTGDPALAPLRAALVTSLQQVP